MASFCLGHSYLHGQKAQRKFLRENYPSKDRQSTCRREELVRILCIGFKPELA